MPSLKTLLRKPSGASAKYGGSGWAACCGYAHSHSWSCSIFTHPSPINQATLEIEFMHQTLSRYVTGSADKTLSELYTKISQSYAKRPGDENLQAHLDGVKKTLAEARRATGIEFLCFRQTKDRSKDKSRDPENRTRERRKERSDRSDKK